MPELTAADEMLIHQLPLALPNVATHHEHWRESLFFVLHPPDGAADADVLILTAATYPARQVLDSYQMGRVDGSWVFALHERPHDGDPHTPTIPPMSIEVVRPYEEVRLRVDEHPSAPYSLDVTFRARTPAHGLRRGTMRWRDELVWDQSHMIQAGVYDGTYTVAGEERPIDGWWGQRDHSWGIRDHDRCPMWMWFAIQLEDGMLGVWSWEYANGAPVYLDGCWAPADGGAPTPVVGFDTSGLSWVGADGRPTGYGRDGTDVRGLAGRVEVTLEGGRVIGVEGEGETSMPYGSRGGGQTLLRVRTDDGRTGSAIYEITGAHHHRWFPVPPADRPPPG